MQFSVIKLKVAVLLGVLLSVGIAIAEPVDDMRSRFLHVLTNQEVEQYLERSDIIFIPVGVTEMHGALPLDAETVLPQAFALRMAEQVDGLVLGNLPYFYAGATTIGRGTVQVSVREGIDYLHGIANSLLRQGFRRQVYVSFHGPAHLTVSPVVREIFDETLAPVLYIDLVKVAAREQRHLFESVEDMYSLFIGAYDMLGRLNDVPLTTDKTDRSTPSGEPFTTLTKSLGRLAESSGAVGFYFGRKTDHALTPVMRTAAQRQKLANKGKLKIDTVVGQLDLPNIIKQLKQLDEYQQNQIVPRYGELLPGVYNGRHKD